MAKHTSDIFLTVDAVVFKTTPAGSFILLIRRSNEPYKNLWALPGGFVEADEPLETAMRRELEEETALRVDAVIPIGIFDKPDRDPRGRMVSMAYMAVVDYTKSSVNAGDDADDAQWFDVNTLPELAFDHQEIIIQALKLQKAQALTDAPLSFIQIKETCLYVTDLAQTRAFYEGKLGLECFSEVAGRHIFFRAGSSVLLCFIAEATKNDQNLPPHYGYGQQHFAFECHSENYNAWRQKLVNAGITIIQDVVWQRGGRSFYFHDPDENVAEIIEPGIWEW